MLHELNVSKKTLDLKYERRKFSEQSLLSFELNSNGVKKMG